MGDEWRDQLADLFAGPYAGRGGRIALAAQLGVKPGTVSVWRREVQSPSHRWRVAIARLWQAHGLDRAGEDVAER